MIEWFLNITNPINGLYICCVSEQVEDKGVEHDLVFGVCPCVLMCDSVSFYGIFANITPYICV